MTRPGVGLSRVVGVALGALLFEAIRRQLRSNAWDFGHAEAASGDQADRTVVAVTFSREEFRAVSATAEATGTRAAEFIHDAALARARGS